MECGGSLPALHIEGEDIYICEFPQSDHYKHYLSKDHPQCEESV